MRFSLNELSKHSCRNYAILWDEHFRSPGKLFSSSVDVTNRQIKLQSTVKIIYLGIKPKLSVKNNPFEKISFVPKLK